MKVLAEVEDGRSEAKSMCSAYKVKMVRLTEQFGFGTEGEVKYGKVTDGEVRRRNGGSSSVWTGGVVLRPTRAEDIADMTSEIGYLF